MLKAVVSSHCLSNYKDLFNLCHLVHRWCTATYIFFLSCDEITVTSEDVANQLLLPILGDFDPGALELSLEEEAELRKGINGNAKLSPWVGSFFKASIATCHATFITFGFVSSFLALILIML